MSFSKKLSDFLVSIQVLNEDPEKDKKLREKVATLINNGLDLCSLGRYTEAIESYDKALEIVEELKKYYPDLYASTLLNKGIALYKLGKHKEELSCYNKALKVYSSFIIEIVAYKIVALSKLRKYEEAREWYNKEIESINSNMLLLRRNENLLKFNEILDTSGIKVKEFPSESAKKKEAEKKKEKGKRKA